MLAAAAALTAVIGLGIHRLRTDGDEPPTSAELADAALHDPDATVVDLDDPQTDAPAARLVIDPTDHAYVLLDHLDELTPDRTYQLWRTEGTTPISVALLGRGTPDVIPVTVPTGQARLAITAEPRRGSPAPTGPILAAGTLPS
jgi:anti-sigma-K factor RskA